MTSAQPELSFERVEGDDARIGQLVAFLAGKDWMTAGEIVARLTYLSQLQWPDRLVRDLAAASRGRIAGGQRGYKLVREMSRDEKDHACHWMKSQARKMDTRADEIELEWRVTHPEQVQSPMSQA